MKIILSRKGFDSSTGKRPSPIFPDKSMLSLPIPDDKSAIAYKEIAGNSWASVGQLVKQLAGFDPADRAHLDPDLNPHSFPRTKDWRPLFGQSDQAESHLRNMGVGPRDVFLFFGLFRSVEQVGLAGSRWQYVRSIRPKHVIFGWLQIAQRIPVNEWPTKQQWAKYHPHFADKQGPNNVIYVAKQSLELPGFGSLGVNGAGVFQTFTEKLQLTAPVASSPSHWLLPRWFNPIDRASTLSYHGNPSRWKKSHAGTELSSVGRGQEFVLNCEHYPEAVNWLYDLISCTQTAKNSCEVLNSRV